MSSSSIIINQKKNLGKEITVSRSWLKIMEPCMKGSGSQTLISDREVASSFGRIANCYSLIC